MKIIGTSGLAWPGRPCIALLGTEGGLGLRRLWGVPDTVCLSRVFRTVPDTSPSASFQGREGVQGVMLATLVASSGLVAHHTHHIKPTTVRSRALPFMSVEVKTIEPGDGKTFPLPGQRVSAHYTGRLVDGTVFDTSRKDFNRPFSFQIGVGSVIKGWDVGIAKMSTGEKAELTIEPSHGYGKKGAPPTIPGDATLIFEVELISVSGTPREEW